MDFLDRRLQNLGEVGFWEDKHEGDLRKVAGHFYADAWQLDSLPPWERSRLRAIAAALSCTKAVLCGLSAARVWGATGDRV